jgi:general secretion pathway protein G
MQLMLSVMILGAILSLAAQMRIPERGCAIRGRTTEALLVSVAGQLDIFKQNHTRYPDSLDELMHVPSWLEDPRPSARGVHRGNFQWTASQAIYRRLNSLRKPFVLLSLGADGREGGEGQDADIAY